MSLHGNEPTSPNSKAEIDLLPYKHSQCQLCFCFPVVCSIVRAPKPPLSPQNGRLRTILSPRATSKIAFSKHSFTNFQHRTIEFLPSAFPNNASYGTYECVGEIQGSSSMLHVSVHCAGRTSYLCRPLVDVLVITIAIWKLTAAHSNAAATRNIRISYIVLTPRPLTGCR